MKGIASAVLKISFIAGLFILLSPVVGSTSSVLKEASQLDASAKGRTTSPNSDAIKVKIGENKSRSVLEYDNTYIDESFAIELSEGDTATYDDSSAAWDVEIIQGKYPLLVDLSGQGKKSFEQSLADWVTRWGSREVEFDFTILGQDNTEDKSKTGKKNSYPYKMFQVEEKGEQPYFMMIVDVGPMYDGRAHLAIRTDDPKGPDILKLRYSSIHKIEKELNATL